MVAKRYNISVNGEDSYDCYLGFIKQYLNNIKRVGQDPQIYEINDSAIIVNMINEKELNERWKCNLTLIGIKENINQTIEEIKQKGFTLEEITN